MDLSPLELLAELSIGLVGFAGVVSALGSSRLTDATRTFRIQALLVNGVTSLTFSILPIILFSYDFNENSVWTISALCLVTTQALILGWSVRRVNPVTQDVQILLVIRMTIALMLLAVIIYLLYGIIMQVNFLASIYLVGVTASFGLGMFHFCVLVISIQSSANDA